MDDAAILATLDRTFRTVVQIRGRLNIYDGHQELLTDALRRLAATGQVEANYRETGAPMRCRGRSHHLGPRLFRIELYRLPCVAGIEIGDVALLTTKTDDARLGATHGATNHDQN